jgi:hypothetical protein
VTESAHASFRDVVLEVTMDAPPAQPSDGRRIDTSDTPREQHEQMDREVQHNRDERQGWIEQAIARVVAQRSENDCRALTGPTGT